LAISTETIHDKHYATLNTNRKSDMICRTVSLPMTFSYP